jgi:hypothetical protein
MKLLKLLPILFLLSSCVYTDIKIPLDRDVWETKLGTKVGVASNHTVLWLVSWGDAGVKKAAENGGLTKVEHLDMGIQSYLFGVYTRTDTIAYGD